MNVFFDHCSVYTSACAIIYTLIAILYFGLEVITCSLLLIVVDKCRDHLVQIGSGHYRNMQELSGMQVMWKWEFYLVTVHVLTFFFLNGTVQITLAYKLEGSLLVKYNHYFFSNEKRCSSVWPIRTQYMTNSIRTLKATGRLDSMFSHWYQHTYTPLHTHTAYKHHTKNSNWLASQMQCRQYKIS